MGGFGSGRYGGTATAEGTASYVLAASVLTRAWLQVGQRGSGTSYFGEEKFPVEIRVDTMDASNPFLELTHRTRDDREGDRIVRDRIRLISYGGRRWWFQCPRTGRRTTKLFLQNGGGISGAAKPIGSGMPASAKGASIAFSEEPRR